MGLPSGRAPAKKKAGPNPPYGSLAPNYSGLRELLTNSGVKPGITDLPFME